MRPKTLIRKLKVCYGISSDASSGHVLFLDYDNKDFQTVYDHCLYAIHEYTLGDIYVIASSHGFNAICLDMIPLAECQRIMLEVFSPVDRAFATYGFNRGYYTLRFDKDKMLRCVVHGHQVHQKSKAHKLFLEWFFDIEIYEDHLFDQNDTLKVIQFPSDKNGYHVIEEETPLFMKINGEIHDK